MTWRPKTWRIPLKSPVRTENLKSQPTSVQYTCDRTYRLACLKELDNCLVIVDLKRNSYRDKNRCTPPICSPAVANVFPAVAWLVYKRWRLWNMIARSGLQTLFLAETGDSQKYLCVRRLPICQQSLWINQSDSSFLYFKNFAYLAAFIFFCYVARFRGYCLQSEGLLFSSFSNYVNKTWHLVLISSK